MQLDSNSITKKEMKYEFEVLGKEISITLQDEAKYLLGEKEQFQEYFSDGQAFNIQDAYDMQFIRFSTIKFIYKHQDNSFYITHEKLKTKLKGFIDNVRVLIIDLKYDQQSIRKYLQQKLKQMNAALKMIPISNNEKLVIYYMQSQASQLETIIEKIKEFTKIEVIFPFDKYYNGRLISGKKSKLSLEEEIELENDFLFQIIKTFQKEIKQIALDLYLQVFKITPFIKNKIRNIENSDFKDFNGRLGFSMQVEGRIDILPHLFLKIDHLFVENPFNVIEIDELKLCKPHQIPKHFPNIKIFLMRDKKVCIFNKNEKPAQIAKKLRTGKWIINHPAISKEDLKKIYQDERKFKDFVQIQRIEFQSLIVQVDCIMMTGVIESKNELMRSINNFLKQIEKEIVQCSEFKSLFEAAVFLQYQWKQMQATTSEEYKLKIWIDNDTLYRQNYKKDSEKIEEQLKNRRIKMLKNNIMIWPTKKLIQKQPIYYIIKNPPTCDLQYISARRYLLQNKFTIISRNFNSIKQNIASAVFLIHDLKDCNEFIEVMEENGLSLKSLTDAPKTKKQSRVVHYMTKKSKFFDDIVSWIVNIREKNDDRFKNDFVNQVFHLNKHQKRINFVLPASFELIDYAVKNILQLIAERAKILEKQVNLREIYFYYSKCADLKDRSNYQQCNQLKNRIQDNLKQMSKDKLCVLDKLNNLHLNTADVQKIVNLKKFDFVYAQMEDLKNPRHASPVSSFIFNFQSSQIENYPIFLPGITLLGVGQIVEYLVNCGSLKSLSNKQNLSNKQRQELELEQLKKADVFIIKENQPVIKSQKTLKEINASLYQTVRILKEYFAKLEYVVLYSNADGTNFSSETYLFSKTESPIKKTIYKININLESEKISKNKQTKLKYELIANQNAQEFQIFTHKNAIQTIIQEENQQKRESMMG